MTPDGEEAPEGHRPTLRGRTVASRSLVISGLAAVASAFDAGSAVVTSRMLQPGGRGLFAVTVTVAAVVAVLACLGVTTAARVLLVSQPPRLLMQEYLAMAPVHTFGAGAVATLAITGLVLGVIGDGTAALVIAGACASAGLAASAFVFDGLHAVGQQRWAATCNAAGSGLSLIATVLVAASGSTFVPTYVLALSVSYVGQVAIGLVLLMRRVRRPMVYRHTAHVRAIREGLSALPYLGLTLVTFRLDRYLVGAIAGLAAAGVYSVAATASELFRQLPNAVGQVLLFGRASGQASADLERRARYVSVSVAVIALAGVAWFAEDMIGLLFGKEFTGAVEPLRILLIGEVFIGLWLIDSRLLIGSGRLGAASASAMLSATVMVALDLALIPHFGTTGAAAASVAAYVAAAAAAAMLLSRERRLACHQGRSE